MPAIINIKGIGNVINGISNHMDIIVENSIEKFS